jgi:NitT/TauT family transport system permease protein
MRGALPRSWYSLAIVCAGVLLLFVWAIASHILGKANVFLPPPQAVAAAAYDDFVRFGYIRDLGVSTFRVFLGFALSAVLAVPLGIAAGTYRLVEAIVEPLNDFVRYMPVVAFVPLLILWSGTGDVQKVLVIWLGTFPQLFLMTAAAAAHVPREYLETYYMLGGRGVRHLRTVVAPAAAPEILDALRVSAGWAWSYVVVAEVVAAEEGLGFKILQAQRFLKTASMIGCIIASGLLGVATDYIFKQVAAYALPWQKEGR